MRLREVEGASLKKAARPSPVRRPREDERGPRKERSSATQGEKWRRRSPPLPPPPRSTPETRSLALSRIDAHNKGILDAFVIPVQERSHDSTKEDDKHDRKKDQDDEKDDDRKKDDKDDQDDRKKGDKKEKHKKKDKKKDDGKNSDSSPSTPRPVTKDNRKKEKPKKGEVPRRGGR